MKKTLLFLITLIFAVIVAFPLFYALSASLFEIQDFTATPARIITSHINLNNYIRALGHNYYLRYLTNSLIMAFLGTALRLSIAFLAAYAFATFNFKGKELCFFILIGTLFFPSDVMLQQNYLTVVALGLKNTYLGLVITSILGVSQIIVLRLFFISIPQALYDSAKIDGAGDFIIMRHILLPLSSPLLASLALQSGLSFFNSYLWPLIITDKVNMRTIQVGITMLGFSESLDYGPLFAAISIILLPTILVFIFTRKLIVKALTKNYLYT